MAVGRVKGMGESPEYLRFGGLAVMEGVMMRSPNFWSVACRLPSDEIIVRTEPIEKTWIGRQKWLDKPFLRGSLALLDTMALGSKAMGWASDQQIQEEAKKSGQKVSGWVIAGTLALSLAIGFLIFDASPEIVAQFAQDRLNLPGIGANLIAETMKIILFIAYLVLIRRMPQILEVFRYHGAEHQAINCREAGQELTTENCLAHSRFHNRCGTNFAIIVLLISFLVFVPFPREFPVGPDAPNFLIVLSRLIVKMAIIPLISGIAYEVIRWAGRSKDKRLVELLLKPGLSTQLITTEVPAEKHAEVAIIALQSVEEAENGAEPFNGIWGEESGGAEEPAAPDEGVGDDSSEAGLADEVAVVAEEANHHDPGQG